MDTQNQHGETNWQRRERIAQQELKYQRARRTADTWPDALMKQASLFREAQDDLKREAANSGSEVDAYYFGDAAEACDRAYHIYVEEVRAIGPELEAIRTKIAHLQRQQRELLEAVPSAVAARLETEADGREGWISVCKAFFDVRETERDLSRWLGW